METSCRRLAGRVFQNFGPEKFIVDFHGVCSYLLDVICILVSEFITVHIISS